MQQNYLELKHCVELVFVSIVESHRFLYTVAQSKGPEIYHLVLGTLLLNMLSSCT